MSSDPRANRGMSGMAILFLATASLLIGTIGFTYWVGRTALESNRTLGQQQEVIQRLEHFLSVLKDAETGQRGYLLTGEDAYLEPYRKATVEIRSDLEAFWGHISSGDVPKEPMLRVMRLTEEKLAELGRTIDARRDRGAEAALAIVRTDEGKQIMDEIRTRVAEVERGEEAEFRQAAERLNAATWMRTGAFALTALANLGFLGWVYRRISLEMERRAAAVGEAERERGLLRQSEERLRTILDTLPVAIFLSDASGRVIFTNVAVDRIWGISRLVTRDEYGQYQGRWLASGRPVEPNEWALARTLDTGELWVNDLVEVDLGEGERKILHNYSIPIRDGQRALTGVVVVTEDVTEATEAQEQVREAKEAAERTAAELARSNQDLEQFAYVASHDLQEPLRMIRGYLELLSERYKGQIDEKADKYIGYAVDGAGRMSGLIRDLLSFSRVNTRGETFGSVPCEEALDYALRNLERSIETSGAKVTHESLPLVSGDKTQLAQLFQNLVGNAIKFRSSERSPEIHIAVRLENGQWLFQVRDNGIGFEQQYEGKIFKIFQRLHDRGQYPGTGIGLAICRRIVERHGGQIWAAGEPGQGATFFFTIPERGIP